MASPLFLSEGLTGAAWMDSNKALTFPLSLTYCYRHQEITPQYFLSGISPVTAEVDASFSSWCISTVGERHASKALPQILEAEHAAVQMLLSCLPGKPSVFCFPQRFQENRKQTETLCPLKER
ncbi:hypothetical protein KIL84_017395 [Mauremys mutica]|uniref:Uncharacterized protein n=1 Tax=Mauremys mutica TaxID=74926 RepID=A0A9D3X596_9SAUR|nr:hypothetical protein KIL84_017395 [Mauremys mutica]